MQLLRNPAFLFPLTWLIVNLLQACFTELSADEAYYWMYSRFPAFGYFDHPPVIAFFIRAGYALFDNTLGVRLFTVITEIMTLLICWQLITVPGKEKHRAAFWLLAAAIPVLQVYGFIATPDSPLLFFTALFLLIYRWFLESPGYKTALLLGVVMAAMIYSKYHALLVITAVVFSNPRLLRSGFAWLAVLAAALCMLPHLLWQLAYEFPSVYYHFYWRVAAYEFHNLTDFLVSQFFVFGPLMYPALWYLRRKKLLVAEGLFEGALLFIAAGVLLLFLVFTVRTRIEAHWTLVCAVPLLYFLFSAYLRAPGPIQKTMRYAFGCCALLLTIVRGVLFFDVLPVKNEFHRNAEAAAQLARVAGTDEVVFVSSYMRASVFSFYTGKLAHSMNGIRYRKNQFNFWPIVSGFTGKPVTVFSSYPVDNKSPKRIALSNGDTLFYQHIDAFEPEEGVQVQLPLLKETYAPGTVVSIPVVVQNTNKAPVNFKNPGMRLRWNAYYCRFGQIIHETDAELLPELNELSPGETRHCTLRVVMPDEQATFNLGLAVRMADAVATFNSNLTLITIR